MIEKVGSWCSCASNIYTNISLDRHDIQIENFLKIEDTIITFLKSGEYADYKSSNQKFIW